MKTNTNKTARIKTYTVETYLPVFTGFYNTIFEGNEDYEFECNKILCPVCDEWYNPMIEAKEVYDKQVEKLTKAYTDATGKQPQVRSFEKWVLLQGEFKHCPDYPSVLN